MNRQMKRMMRRQEAEEARPRVRATPAGERRERTSRSRTQQAGAPKRTRTSARQYVKESAAELRRVDWPTRQQVITYTTVALICVVVLGTLVAVFDWGVSELVVKIFT